MKKSLLNTLLGLFLVSLWASGNAVIRNRLEFMALCRLLMLAEKGADEGAPQSKADELVGWNEGNRILQDLKDMDSMLAKKSELAFNHSVESTGENITINEANRRFFQESVRTALPLAESLLRRADEQRTQIHGTLQKAQKKFIEAMVGGQSADWPSNKKSFKFWVNGKPSQDPGTGERKSVCLADKSGEGGSTLQLDLLCLCATADGSGTNTKAICGFDTYTTSSNTVWHSTTGKDDAYKAWPTIYDACEKQVGLPKRVDIPAVEEAIRVFEHRLGAGTERITAPTGDFSAILGSVASGATTNADGKVCDGGGALSSAAHGVCVSYRAEPTGKINITWRERLREAEGFLATAQNEGSKARQTLRRMEELRAEVLKDGRRLPDPPLELKDGQSKDLPITSSTTRNGPPGNSTGEKRTDATYRQTLLGLLVVIFY